MDVTPNLSDNDEIWPVLRSRHDSRNGPGLDDLPTEILAKIVSRFSFLADTTILEILQHYEVLAAAETDGRRRTLLSLCLVNRRIGALAASLLLDVVCPTYRHNNREFWDTQEEALRNIYPVEYEICLKRLVQRNPFRIAEAKLLVLEERLDDADDLASILPAFEHLQAILVEPRYPRQTTMDALVNILPTYKRLQHISLRCQAGSSSHTQEQFKVSDLLAALAATCRPYETLTMRDIYDIALAWPLQLRFRQVRLSRVFYIGNTFATLARFDRSVLEGLYLSFESPQMCGTILSDFCNLGWPALRTIGLSNIGILDATCSGFGRPDALPALQRLVLSGSIRRLYARDTPFYRHFFATLPPSITTLVLGEVALSLQAMSALLDLLYHNPSPLGSLKCITILKRELTPLTLAGLSRRRERQLLIERVGEFEVLAVNRGITLEPRNLAEVVAGVIAKCKG